MRRQGDHAIFRPMSKNSFKRQAAIVLTLLLSCLLAYGVAIAYAQVPEIDSISAETLPRSGRLKVYGSDFGSTQGSSVVSIGGIVAPVTRWSNTRITAYVPESSSLGVVDVQVMTGAGMSNEVPLTVTLRERDGRVVWRFEADSENLWWRPAIAPDGTIYAHGSEGFVYALQPDGGLKWISRVDWYPYGPPSAGSDGSVYLASIQTVYALDPDGILQWRFTDNSTQGVMVGPNVGPDGNIYVANDWGLGAYALSPVGELLWNNPGVPPMWYYGGLGADVVFGPRWPGTDTDQMYVAADRGGTDARLYGFLLDGTQRFAVPIGGQDSPFRQQQTQPAVGPDGAIYVTHFKGYGIGWALESFEPRNGQSLWYFPGSGDMTPPEVGPDGIVYWATIGDLVAFDPVTRTTRWSFSDGTILDYPSASPRNDMVVSGGVITYGAPGFVKAVSTSGELLWTVDLPGTFYPGPRVVSVHHPRFTSDGRTVYVSTTILSGDPDDPHSYLYAIDTRELIPGDVDIRRREPQRP